MTQVKLVKIKFKHPEGKRAWTSWSDELKRRKEEVLATLKNEGVVSESCFLSEDEEYAYYFMEAGDLEKAKKAVLTNPHPIDAEHKKARESSLEFVTELECLFHFENRTT